MAERIYLDSASTTPLEPRVWQVMHPYLATHFGNAASIHAFGQQTKAALEEAREHLALQLGAKPSEIFFTSGGTEANNFALKGFVMAAVRQGIPVRLISSRLEHKAVLESLLWLESFFRVPICFIRHDGNGRLDLDELRTVLAQAPHTATLVSLMHANNELGNLNPIEQIAAIVKEHNAVLHTDAVQSAGKVPIDVKQLGVDMLSISGHKFYAPKGIGALFIRQGIAVEPLLHGGSHERNRRAGTENYAFALAQSEALRLAVASLSETTAQMRSLQRTFLDTLLNTGVRFERNGDPDNALPHILNLTFPSLSQKKLARDVLLLALDAAGVAVSSGSACTSGTEKPSHVLLSLGRSEADARASIRVSFSKFNTVEEVQDAAQRIADVVRRLQL